MHMYIYIYIDIYIYIYIYIHIYTHTEGRVGPRHALPGRHSLSSAETLSIN